MLEAAIAANASTLEELQAASYEGKTVEELTTDAGALLGEKIVVRRVARVEGENVAVYLHNDLQGPARTGLAFCWLSPVRTPTRSHTTLQFTLLQ